MQELGLTPENLERLTIFLLPGLIFLVVFFFLIPDRKKSELSFILLSVLASVILRIFTEWLFGIVNFLSNLKLTLQSSGAGFDWTSRILGVILAVILSKLVQTKKFKDFFKKRLNIDISFGRLWNNFLRVDRNTAVRVFLKDGSVYVGQLGRVSDDPNDEVQEIELLHPYEYDSSEKGKGNVRKIDESESMLIEAAAISSIEKIKDEDGKKLYDF